MNKCYGDFNIRRTHNEYKKFQRMNDNTVKSIP